MKITRMCANECVLIFFALFMIECEFSNQVRSYDKYLGSATDFSSSKDAGIGFHQEGGANLRSIPKNRQPDTLLSGS